MLLVGAWRARYLLFARAERRDFQLPGGDGAVVMVAGVLGGAAADLLALFDKPGASNNCHVGIAVGHLLRARRRRAARLRGLRMRAPSARGRR